MITRLLYFVAILAVFAPSTFAEGLLYKVPADGHWARFELAGKAVEADGTEITLEGTVTISSVGTVEIDGKKCRWIEIVTEAKRAGDPFTDIDKVLIPEEHLAKGKEPLKHVVKAWHKHSMIDGPPREIQDLGGSGGRYLRKLGPHLHGPYEDPKELKAVGIDGKFGHFDCKGIAASEKLEQGGGVKFNVTYEIRLHPAAPFGVVTWDSEFTGERNGQALGTMTTKMKLVEFGTDAKSVIPDAQ